MSSLDQLFQETPESTSDFDYAQLTGVRPCNGIHGRFVKLLCLDEEGIPIEATADQRHFHLLEPYFNELRVKSKDPDADWPVVPLFKGNDGRWRFSWHTAARDNPNLALQNQPTDISRGVYRMQVSVPGDLAARFKQTAQSRGLSHTDFLMSLILDAVT